jgi:arabinan endo-1,5-alpha-L-arabinosidase
MSHRNAAAPDDANVLLDRAGRRNARVHDPSTIVRCGDRYYLYATGNGVSCWHSRDLLTWERGPAVFPEGSVPAWTRQAVPKNTGHLWAPDIIKVGKQYLLYYSVSSFGVRTSAIGLAVSPTLDLSDPAYRWTDRGLVVRTDDRSDHNAIDPSVFQDPRSGGLWMAYGSFWSGIKLVQLDPATGLCVSPGVPPRALAWNQTIEAPALYQRGRWYYLFVNWGFCCRGADSTYEIRIGRSERVTGPYRDKQGVDLLRGGGSLFLGSNKPFVGPGHAGVVAVGRSLYLSCHFYDATQRGAPTLAIRRLRFDRDGWPTVAEEIR